MTAPRLHVVSEDASRRADPYGTRVPAGDYHVALVGEERQTLFGRDCWRTRWRIVDGEHLGAELYGWWNLPRGRFGPRNAYATAVAIATERRAPRDLARHHPSHFFGDCVLLARVRDVARDSNGVERPDGARYSRLGFMLRRLSGAPPALRGGR